MPILSAQTSFTGLSGIQPNLVFINTNDTIATVTTAGYLTHAVQEGLLTLQNGYMALVNTTVNQAPHTPPVPVWLQVSITGTAPNLVYSLVTPENGGGAIFLGNVQAGANGIAGGFISYPGAANTGNLFLFATANAANYQIEVTNASFGQASSIIIPDPGVALASFLLTQSAGTQIIGTGNLSIAQGNLTLGSAGHASTLTLFPSTAANGTLIISPLNAGGAFNTTIRNSIMGQSTVFSIPDPAAATANFMVANGALVSGNLVVAAGTNGTMIDAGIVSTNVQLKSGVKAVTTADIGGGGAGPITVASASLTAASVIVATIKSSTNTVAVAKCVAGAGNFNITFTADPGASCIVNYVAYVVAQ